MDSYIIMDGRAYKGSLDVQRSGFAHIDTIHVRIKGFDRDPIGKRNATNRGGQLQAVNP